MNFSESFINNFHSRNRKGAALVVVLAFVVLLTGLIIAFFSRSVTIRQIASSSSNVSRVNLFANGAVASIIGDLQQEIAAGSSVTTITEGGTSTTLYPPDLTTSSGNQSFAPCRVGVLDAATFPNLLKRSAYNQPFYSSSNVYPSLNTYPASNRAANIATTATSNNGRVITTARWNMPLLLPKKISTETDQTPVDSKGSIAPDWIFVGRDGENPKSIDLKSEIIGRYAYMIYDEGGLLDINVAGYPSVTGTQDFSYKSALSYADLHLIPGISDLTTSRQNEVIDAIVGWRQYASAQADGDFPKITISSGSNYVASIAANKTGFLQISGSTVRNGRTDQVFTSRQQLKNFLLSGIATDDSERASLQTAMQYLGTFSRDLEQPSYIPHPQRPTVLALGSGGNDAATKDDEINPNFLKVRAKAIFERPDGTSAVAGEPLVKKRFALNRLAWLTYKGPSATRTKSDADISKLISTYGITWDYLQQGTAETIQKYFGLTWKVDTDGQYKWFYNVHNGTSGTGEVGRILSLKEISALNAGAHEPDFIELLKAGIHVGSIAKPFSKSVISSFGNFDTLNYQYPIDTSTDYAIIKIAANIIDQYDVDGYSTHIVFDDGIAHSPAIPKDIIGVEDQPYIYRIRTGMMRLRDAVSSVSGTTIKNVNPDPDTAYMVPPGTLKDTGVMMLMALPEVWNPHDANNPLPPSVLRPTEYRVVAYSGANPGTVNSGATVKLSAYGQASVSTVISLTGTTKVSSASAPTLSSTSAIASMAPYFTKSSAGASSDQIYSGGYKPSGDYISPSTASLTFSVSASLPEAFREPTMLVKPSASSDARNIALSLPSGSIYTSIKGNNGNAWNGSGFVSSAPNPLRLAPGEPGYNDVPGDDPGSYIGLPLALFPARWIADISVVSSGTAIAGVSGTYMITAGGAMVWNGLAGSNINRNLCYCLQYKDGSGNWITYDVKYVAAGADYLECPIPSSSNPVPRTAMGDLISPVALKTCYTDPRTARFGAPVGAHPIFHSSTYPYIDSPGAEFYYYYTGGMPEWNSLKERFRGWLDSEKGILLSERPDETSGFGLPGSLGATASNSWKWIQAIDPGWHVPVKSGVTGGDAEFLQRGLLSQNTASCLSDGLKFSGDTEPAVNAAGEPHFYTDPDGVLRRAMGAYVQPGTSTTAATTIGLPMSRALNYPSNNLPSGVVTSAQQFQSRPMVLNRPFRSVGELGYVFSGTPWKNLSFFTPESGDSALLDLFCIRESNDPNGLVAGKVNLNARQAPVLKAILAGAYKDEQDNIAAAKPIGTLQPLTEIETDAIAKALVARTSGTNSGQGALTNVADLVGRWKSKVSISGSLTLSPSLPAGMDIDGSQSYDGFSNDLTNVFSTFSDTQAQLTMTNIQRFRESSIRALANTGTTRVWNLMIDIIAQTGRYPGNAKTLANFTVDGEQRYWVHLAIDRITGEILDRKIEAVRE